MTKEKVNTKDMTEFDGPVDTGNAHVNRPGDKDIGDKGADESVAKKAKKGSDLPGTTTIGEEVKQLFSSVEGLSEDFTEKATVIFEGAVSEHVSLIMEALEEEYNTRLEEAYDNISETLETKLDEYLNLFIENYLEENKVAIETGFRQEIAEEVISSVNTIIENAGVYIPEEKVDLAESLTVKNENLVNELNKALTETIELKKQLRKYEFKGIFEDVTEGLSEASKDRLKKLTENMEFGNTDEFTKKLEILKESISDNTATTSKSVITEAAPIKETSTVTDARMKAYIAATTGSFLK